MDADSSFPLYQVFLYFTIFDSPKWSELLVANNIPSLVIQTNNTGNSFLQKQVEISSR